MVADVLAGAYAAVNAVSLYVERGQETLHSVHVEAAERVAVQAHRVGVDGSPTSRASGPMPPRHPSTSESAGKASWR
jgi:hypothetical protein